MKEAGFDRVFETPIEESYFYGYFGMVHIDSNDQKMLCHRVSDYSRLPNGKDIAEVGYFDLNDKEVEFKLIGETTAYNWQQGSMLQFLGPDFRSKVIWNIYSDGEYKSCIYNMDSGETEERQAIYAVARNGVDAYTIDYERHYWCRRGYSYQNIIDEKKNANIVAGDGISHINLLTGVKTDIVEIGKLMEIDPISTMVGATHYIEHLTVSPSGERMVFMHRWRHENGIHSRLLCYNRLDESINTLVDSGRMSHYSWISETELIAYGGRENAINRLRKYKLGVRFLFRPFLPMYKAIVNDNTKISKTLTGDGYMVINTENKETRMVAMSVRLEDGHPVGLKQNNIIVTDTYARAKLGQRPRLLVVDIMNDTTSVIDELDSIEGHDESATRCDLHPCISAGGRLISIDTMDRGQRRIYVYKTRL